MALPSLSPSSLLLPPKPSCYSSSKSPPCLFSSTYGKTKITKIRSVGVRNLTFLNTETKRRNSRARKRERSPTFVCRATTTTESPGRWFPPFLLLPERMKVLCLVALVMCLCNADRVVMSVAAMPLCADHSWSTSFLGVVQSSFLWGYLVSSTVGGALADKHGGKLVMTVGVVLWSLATIITPWAASHSTMMLMIVRILFGLAEGVAIPSMNIILSQWFSSCERASAVGFSMAGFHLGNAISFMATPVLMTKFGITGPFTVFSILGFVWTLIWTLTMAKPPSRTHGIMAEGKSDHSAIGRSLKSPSVAHLLSKMPTWGQPVAIIHPSIHLSIGLLCASLLDASVLQDCEFFHPWMPFDYPWGLMAVSGYIAGICSDYLTKSGCSWSGRKVLLRCKAMSDNPTPLHTPADGRKGISMTPLEQFKLKVTPQVITVAALAYQALLSMQLIKSQVHLSAASSLPAKIARKEISSTVFFSASYSPKYRFTHYNGPAVSANFSFKEVFKATNNFSALNKIGEGNFGSIYKGKLKDGTTVAFKYAKKNPNGSHSSAEFKNEIKIMSKIEHLNLVKLYGFLEQDDERIIIVEYVANGNLREHLSGNRGVTLNMMERIQIAIDVSHAITYLHTYTDDPIIHRDIKATNILITEKLRAKVADFGFARLASEDPNATHVFTEVKGTAGYLDPEYLRTYQLTEKSDVYSFGVLLVELMSGRHSIEPNRPKEKITSKWAMQKLKQGDSVMVMDPNLRRNPASIEALERILDLARRCLEPSRRHRPTMKMCAEILWSIRKDFKKNDTGQTSEDSSTPYYWSEDYPRHHTTGKPDEADVSSTTWGLRAVRDGAEWA